MKKIALISLCCAALFTACGDDSSSTNVKLSSIDTLDIIAKTYDDLPVCSDSREGTITYVKDEKQAYTCHNKIWTTDDPSIQSLESSSSKIENESSCSREASSSETDKTKGSSSSAKTEVSSSSEYEVQSSETESSSSAEPESSAESSSSEESSSSFVSRDIKVGAYKYEFGGLNFLDLTIYNDESGPIDNLTLRIYFTAKPEEVEKCATLIDIDICQAYDEEGYVKPCETGDEIRILMRHALPVRLDDSYDATTGKFTYFFPIPLGSTTIKSLSSIRIDFGFSSGISNDHYTTCETMRTRPKKNFSDETNDWSWMAHQKDVDGADYEGIPLWEMDQGDTEKAPINPYIAVYKDDELISGIPPKY